MSRRRFADGALPPPPPYTSDPWSDGETSALLDAWGPRHVSAGGGGLGAGDWQACAVAVNSYRGSYGRAPRSEYQCRNRMDSLKRRLKAGDPSKKPQASPSPSRLLHRLRVLLLLSTSSTPPGFPPHHVKPEVKQEEEEPISTAPLVCDWAPVPKRRRTVSSAPPESSSSAGARRRGGGFGEVAAAVETLTATYESVEAAKQQEAARLQRRRLEVMRDVELERMRLLVDVVLSASASSDPAGSSSW